MFEGTIQTVDLHESPETIHFGLTYDPYKTYTACDSATQSGWYKSYRMNGTAELDLTCGVDAGSYLASSGQVGLSGLAKALLAQGNRVDSSNPPAPDAATHPWWVAYQMIEGVQKVRLLVAES